MDKLAKYKLLRDKQITKEPFTSKDIHPDKLVFVVQKHRAKALHYDFRLEYCGVMASWAIPKGPTLDPALKRLAMQTEDHPLDYRHFEGSIPKGEYGGGEVIIWDSGTYIPEVEQGKVRIKVKVKSEGDKVIEAGIEKGEIKFFLEGKRLKGSFALIKAKGFAGPNAWLLIKHRDKFAKEGFDAKDFDTSVASDKKLS